MLRRDYQELFIDGKWQAPDSKDVFDVVNPATGETIGHVPAGNTTDMDRAVEAARKAFYETDWATRPVEERAEMCERLASLIAEHREEFADLITDELGHAKIIAESTTRSRRPCTGTTTRSSAATSSSPRCAKPT